MKDGEERRKSPVLTKMMVVLAIRAQDRDPGPETTILSQWDAEQEPVGPARSSTGLVWLFLSGSLHSSPLQTMDECREMGWEGKRGFLGQKQHTW